MGESRSLRDSNGEKRFVSWPHSELRNEEEQVIETSISNKESTNHEDSEEALVAAEEKFKTIFENVHDVITYVDTRGKILDVNSRIEDLLGYKREEIIGKYFVKLGLVKLLDVPKLLKLFLGTIQKGEEEKIVVLELKHKNGSRVSVEVGTRFIRDKKGKVVGIVNIFRDVTENKKAEAALVDSEEKFRKVFTIGHDAFLISDLKESTIIDVNERFGEMFGYNREEVIGKSAIQLGIWANLSDRERIAQQLRSKGEVENLEIFCRKKNGESFPILLSVSLLQINNQQLVLSTVRDLSFSKQAEEALNQTMNELVNVNEKLGVVGSLTRHDVRNKLCVITANIYLLKKKNFDNPETVSRLGEMEDACKSITKIFDFAKMYEEIGVGELSLVDVERTLNEAASLFSGLPKAKIVNECHGIAVIADSFLRQLFYNLIDNSIKHGKRVTKIRVHYEIASEGQLNLVYEDDGVGVPVQNKPELFREGFSTGGSGYGLYLIKKMMEAYGWTIRENGEPDVGAKFTITIPKLSKDGKENYQLA